MNELRIKPVLDQATAERVINASREDAHFIYQPTHFVLKGEDIIGAASLCKMPVCAFWMHTKKAQVRDSLITINVLENVAAAQGQHILMPLVHPESPFLSLIQRLGYSQLSTTTIQYKLLS